MFPKEKYLRLGELLIKEGIITQEQLEKAISVQAQQGWRLGEILIKLGVIKEDQLVMALGKQLKIFYYSLGSELKPTTDHDLLNLIPKDFALKNNIIPLSRTLNSITVAMFDPLDLILIDNLKKLTGCEINPVIAAKSDITKAIEKFYGKSKMFEEAMDASYASVTESVSYKESEIADEELSLDKLVARAEEAPVVKLVDLIIRQAIDERASDIHIEPFKDKISLRYRIDGKLYEIPPPAKHLNLPIVSRIKILSKLDIAEKRLPQDGAFLVKLEDRFIDIRVSVIPTIYGEKVVLRILDRGAVALDLGRMGFEPEQFEQIRRAVNSPYGLVLMTGPTGSGKTTSLYAILNEIKSPAKNIVTVEDPVEYKLDGINQVQVKSDIGLTFAATLRSFLRQDPDIMLVGEIRDLETAQICIRSALTGHLVLSTLHTNDAPTAVTRLIDIGIEPYMVAPSLLLVVAQRLIRKLCPDCKEAYEPTAEQLGGVKINAELIYKPKGCTKCNNIGYRGRVCIAEVLIVNDQIKELIIQSASFQKIREVAKAGGMKMLYESAIKKVEDGIASLEEALSITLAGE
ncbi:MAG: Flp pilus assembly complex ATPase component TadA [Candidatus Omnitrophica bacterium]|nr:Flp pilus assembly complex ATPase component TadA [Candidatus Omnitrophota bacterium]MBU4472640.1 Flp pilus assembly complex ATPase component TadA [Candidatus Omnitrophota bacterium]MCG2706737.1 Flp pilus assembly complex ATPase component TadA [Candidatus Omnitrophota bacterium]